jgi:hypothetical protein
LLRTIAVVHANAMESSLLKHRNICLAAASSCAARTAATTQPRARTPRHQMQNDEFAPELLQQLVAVTRPTIELVAALLTGLGYAVALVPNQQQGLNVRWEATPAATLSATCDVCNLATTMKLSDGRNGTAATGARWAICLDHEASTPRTPLGVWHYYVGRTDPEALANVEQQQQQQPVA